MKLVYLKKLLFIFCILLILAAVGISTSYRYLEKYGDKETKLKTATTIELLRGETLFTFSNSAESKGLVSNSSVFYYWVRYFSDYSKFQAGLYRFEGSISPKTIAKNIIAGNIYEPIVFKLVVPEGYTIKKIADKIAKEKIEAYDNIVELATNPDFLKKWKIESSSLEGYLYPATYNFTYYPNAEQIFDKLVKNFWDTLPKEYAARAEELGITVNQAVTMASLIELETKYVDEMPFVSEVIWNRYKRGARLEIDASVIYGIEKFDGDLKWKHLKDESNPYNTRIFSGLPPTPIGSPSLNALQAVLTPSKMGYYFYVLDIDNPEGRHHFSKTLKEHNTYVRKLVKFKRSEKIKESNYK